MSLFQITKNDSHSIDVFVLASACLALFLFRHSLPHLFCIISLLTVESCYSRCMCFPLHSLRAAPIFYDENNGDPDYLIRSLTMMAQVCSSSIMKSIRKSFITCSNAKVHVSAKSESKIEGYPYSSGSEHAAAVGSNPQIIFCQ